MHGVQRPISPQVLTKDSTTPLYHHCTAELSSLVKLIPVVTAMGLTRVVGVRGTTHRPHWGAFHLLLWIKMTDILVGLGVAREERDGTKM